MPLTTAHPAIILPLCKFSKERISITALIIGSMTPDAEYFYHLMPKRTYSHLFAHAWWFDLLIALTLCVIFHLVIRNPLINNLPPFLNRRFIHLKAFNWINHFKQYFFVIITSAWIGIYSHLIWDEFTHRGSYLVENIPFLNIYLTNILSVEIYVHNLLQHLSSLFGTFIVGMVILNLKQKTTNFKNPNWFVFWLKILGVMALFSLTQIGLLFGKLQFNIAYFSILSIGLITGFLVGVFLVSSVELLFSSKVKE